MAEKTKIHIKNLNSSESKKWKELIGGSKTDTRSVEDSPVIAQNQQAYENYLNRNVVQKKKRK
jgi:hypothetical protein